MSGESGGCSRLEKMFSTALDIATLYLVFNNAMYIGSNMTVFFMLFAEHPAYLIAPILLILATYILRGKYRLSALVVMFALAKGFIDGRHLAIPQDSMTGRVAIVTGASAGIGADLARQLANDRGAFVVMACRNLEKCEKVRSRLNIKPELSGCMRLDLADLVSVREFSESVFAAFPDGIDYLINNAGGIFEPGVRTKQNLEMNVGTMHFGHYLLTKLLTPLLKNEARAKRKCIYSENIKTILKVVIIINLQYVLNGFLMRHNAI